MKSGVVFNTIELNQLRKMNLKIILLLLVLVSIIGCKQQESKKEERTPSKTEMVESEKISTHLNNWENAINSHDLNTLKNSYAANAIKIISADSIMNTSSQIASYYETQKHKITAITSLFSIEANKKRGITYELVSYKTDQLKEYIQLVIWKQENEKIIREFEFTETRSLASPKVDTSEITKRRNLWMELCNANNAEHLVKQLYSANTMYFNHKPIIQGTTDLVKEYSYMNNEKYSLKLTPIQLEVVNANFAFEIGQCSGSYGGKYILIWKKLADGKWYIHIDSNI